MERVEEWRDVVGYEQHFQVSNFGRIYSKRTNKILSQGTSKTGYAVLSTRIGGRNGICKCFKVHVLVARAFVPNPQNKPIVNHKDGNKLNNNDNNLEWSTHRENTIHASQMGLLNPVKGEDNKFSKLTEDIVKYCRNVYIPKDKKFGALALSKKFGVSKTTMQSAINGESWKHVK